MSAGMDGRRHLLLLGPVQQGWRQLGAAAGWSEPQQDQQQRALEGLARQIDGQTVGRHAERRRAAQGRAHLRQGCLPACHLELLAGWTDFVAVLCCACRHECHEVCTGEADIHLAVSVRVDLCARMTGGSGTTVAGCQTAGAGCQHG